MSRLLRNGCGLFLACLPIVLGGCQQPLAPAVAQQQPAVASEALVGAGATASLGKTMPFPLPALEAEPCVLELNLLEDPQDKPLLASVPREPECATVQLGDTFLHLLKAFSGR
jgi:hypothetical protein